MKKRATVVVMCLRAGLRGSDISDQAIVGSSSKSFTSSTQPSQKSGMEIDWIG
jgi:hypothetical protein